MLSIIIPVINEESCLAECLARLDKEAGDCEIIVADGGSTDRTCAIAAAHARVRLVRAPKGRGVQMNAGAAVARGDLLIFLHADTRLPAGALARINALPADFQAGCLRQRFDSRHPWLFIISLIHNLRFLVTRIMYGDQVMIVRRALFTRLGGFKDIVMEDLEFSDRLRRVTRPRLLPLTCRTSARKFQAMGLLRATLKVLDLMWAYRRKKDVRDDIFFTEYR